MIFFDSSLIVAYSNEADGNHDRALKIVKDVDGARYETSVIADLLFDEVVAVMLVESKNLGQVAELGEFNIVIF